MKVGDTIYIKPIGNAARRNSEIIEDVVIKVGRKYFETEKIKNIRFFIDSLRHDGGNYSAQYQGYLTLEEIQDEKDARRISEFIGSKFRYGRSSLPIDKLREIEKIILSCTT